MLRRAMADETFTVPDDLAGRPLDGVLRKLAGLSWEKARSRIATGKVQVDGKVVVDARRPVRAGASIALVMSAPKPGTRARLGADVVVYVDAQLVVVRKPAGISTVPYEPGERDTLDRLVAQLLHRSRPGATGPAPSLGIVQRLDKETSGLLVFARTFGAKKLLAHQLRLHTMHRRYLAIAHGDVAATTFRSHLVANRGDGLRGSTDRPQQGQLAITHVEPIERLRGATLVACRLETGRTHQIRIHLSEAGHPLLGERVYVRGFEGPILPAPRLMLHAAELGFRHPTTGRDMRFDDPPPEDMRDVLARLR